MRKGAFLTVVVEDVKRAAAEPWVAAVNAEGSYGRWAYRIAKKTTEVSGIITAASGLGHYYRAVIASSG